MTTRSGLLVVVLAIAAFFAPRLFAGEVVFPHSNAAQVGLEAPAEDESFGLKFSDESSFYVPELHAHLTAPRTGWIATWTNAVELGRPLTHLSGLSPAYPPTFALSLVAKDAMRLYTWLVVLTVVATGVFAFLFFRSAELDAWASVFGALSAALGIPVLYWLSFAMNVSGLCWTFALLWLATSWVARPSVAKLVGIAASAYALLLSGYPQMIVWEGAFVAAWTIARVVMKREEIGARARAIGAIAAAAVLGAACALPVYADVAIAAARSARTDVEPEYFLAALPDARTWGSFARWLATLVDPALLGDARRDDYPVRFSGVALGALVVVLALVSPRARRRRELLPAYALLAVAFAMTASPALYRVGVEHLGLGLSRTVPSWGAIVPAITCAAFALDALVREPMRRPWIASACLVLGAVAVAAATGGSVERSGTTLLALAGALAVVRLRHGAVAAALALAMAWLGGRDFVLMRPRDAIATSSPLVDALEAGAARGERYAIVGAEPRRVLPANEELLLGLASVHSYDSLSSLAYQRFAASISTEGARSRGRRFDRVADASKLDSVELDRANVGLVLARAPIAHPTLTVEGRIGPLVLHRRSGERRAAAVVEQSVVRNDDGSVELLPATVETAAAIVEDEGDRVRVALVPRGEETIVRLARQAHPSWTARGGRAITVDGLYQGVLVPPGASEVTLEFRPWSRFAWIPMVVFALAFGFLGTRALLRGSKDAARREVGAP